MSFLPTDHFFHMLAETQLFFTPNKVYMYMYMVFAW